VSWDLYLVPPEHGDYPSEWLEEVAEEDYEGDDARRQAEAVLAVVPELELHGPFGFESTEESGLPVDIGLHGNHASISIAYWDLGPRAADLAGLVVRAVEALQAETGWVAYDPQEDRIVAVSELGDVFGAGHAQGVVKTAEIIRSLERPKRKRRFASSDEPLGAGLDQ
jgi:hypothetical protein